VLSGRGTCVRPITCPEGPTECGVSECDLETSALRSPRLTRVEDMKCLKLVLEILESAINQN
jgi:hypothetical protein